MKLDNNFLAKINIAVDLRNKILASIKKAMPNPTGLQTDLTYLQTDILEQFAKRLDDLIGGIEYIEEGVLRIHERELKELSEVLDNRCNAPERWLIDYMGRRYVNDLLYIIYDILLDFLKMRTEEISVWFGARTSELVLEINDYHKGKSIVLDACNLYRKYMDLCKTPQDIPYRDLDAYQTHIMDMILSERHMYGGLLPDVIGEKYEELLNLFYNVEM